MRKQGTDTKQEYGEGGVSVGDTENTQGRLYSHQNGATVKYLDQNYFLVDTDGRLKGGISKSAINNIISKSGSVDGVSALKKVNASEDDINSYIDEIKKLNFRVMKLMYNSILFVVATSNNEKIFFWNSKLANQVGSGNYIVNIDPNSFKQKAKDLYQKSYEEIRNHSEIMESKKIKITESKLKQIVTESIRRFLNESEGNSIHKIKKFRTKPSNLPVEVEINIGPDGEGDFEYSVDGGVEDYIEGYLYVEDNEVVDFDGCHDLPRAVKMTLNELGIKCNW